MSVSLISVAILGIGLAAPPSAQPILDAFEIHPDFAIELVAMEPQVLDPVDVAFDEFGRIFVIEMPGYPYPNKPGDLVMLEDEDGDGFYETRHVFATGFAVADSVLPWNGGILVASPPNVEFYRDTDGNNVADEKKVLLEGFATGNQQHNFGGLTYGLDNWIYGSNGGNSGAPHWPGDRGSATPLRFNDFRIDFENKVFELVGQSTGGFELAFDDWGRMFGTHNLTHISQLVFPRRYVDGLPMPREGTLTSISDHDEGETARIYPIGEQETRVNHPEQSGYFSGACGIAHYGGGAFGALNGNVFVCDVVLNLVHRDVLSLQGSALTASRGRDGVDFLATTDRAARFVNLETGPDGALYLVDMHRDVIEHPEWIPNEIEKDLDLDAGKDKGRIFRIVPKGGLDWSVPKFPRDTVGDVVALLADTNQWTRTTAQRLLVEWQDPMALPALNAMLTHEAAVGRLHALWTLEGLGALEPSQVVAALGDGDPGVRENGLRLAEAFMDTPAVADAVAACLSDANPRVRMQAALALSTAAEPPVPKLVRVATRNVTDEWTQHACASALRDRTPRALALLTKRKRAGENAVAFTGRLAEVLAYREDSKVIQRTMNAMRKRGVPKAAMVEAFLRGMADGFEENPRGDFPPPFENAATELIEFALQEPSPGITRESWRLGRALQLPPTETQRVRLANARKVVEDREAASAARVAEMDVLQFAPFDERVDLLFELLDRREPVGVQRAAIAQLRANSSPAVGERVVAMWRNLGPDVLPVASDILLYNSANHGLLLTALEQGDIGLGQMNLHLERRRVLLHASRDTRNRAKALFSDAGVVTRGEALARMRPALNIDGDAVKGQAIFADRCMRCHQIAGEGQNFGPDLTEINRKSRETLLHDILDPNAAVDPEYTSYTIETEDFEILSGLIGQQTDAAVTLRLADGTEQTVRRDAMSAFYTDGLSAMPEELEVDLTPEGFADLLAFLQQPR